MAGEIGNWGRWGKEDERGALNLVTPEVMVRAARLVKRGKAYNLALPIRRSGVPVVGSRAPSVHLMAYDGGDYATGTKAPGNVPSSEDYIFMPTHAGTHIDALAHVGYDGKLYNDYSYDTVKSTGARKCSVDAIGYIVTRGVLLDFPRFKKTECLPNGYAITPEDIAGCAASEGIKFESGDALLLRTGWLKKWTNDPSGSLAENPGLGIAAGAWIGEKDFSAVGADNVAVEKLRPWDGAERGLISPVHVELLRNRGVVLMELLDLEALSKDEVYEFLFVVAPLRITGGVGSPITPLAIA